MANLETAKQNQTAVEIKGHFMLPEQVEEEAKIGSIEYYKTTFPRLVLFSLLILCTGGAILLLCKWKDTLHIRLRCVRCGPAEAGYLLVFGADGTVEPVSMIRKDLCLTGQIKNYKCFVYRLYTYYFDEPVQIYKPVQFEMKDMTFEQVIDEYGRGVTSNQIFNERIMTYGMNSTDIEQKGNLEILIDEISSPFYVFQIFSIVFWAFWNDYALYAIIILVISLITIAISFIKTKISLKKLYERAHYEIEMTVMRPDNDDKSKQGPKKMSSNFLVPGDLVEIPCNKKMPCDVILLNGTCIMNESMLTGESIPIIKQNITKSEKIFDARNADQYLLFSGTECLETRSPVRGSPVMGIVCRTGFDTMKGRLVRSFLYSKPENFKFYRDSVKYLAAMGVVAIICFCVGIKWYMEEGIGAGEYVVHCLEIITCAVPPALPTCLAIGTAMASQRLEKLKIVTKTELKINVAGRVKMMCFDKTGTLTRDSLDLYGVRPVSNGSGRVKFGNLASESIHTCLNSTSEKGLSHRLLELMATCHTLTYVRGVVSGDPLDLKMFEATGWELKETEGFIGKATNLSTVTPPLNINGAASGYYRSASRIEVIKRFEFVAKLQRMSTIVKDPLEKQQRVYVKGSPEVISTLCRPETLPEDFSRALLIYTQSGLRVIACASRMIQEEITPDSQVERESYENDLEFLGFLVFENKMKEVTPSVIAKLKNADIDTMMLTGDNPLTAIFVARDCGIVEKHNKVILGAMVASNDNPTHKKLEWKFIESMQTDENQVANQEDAPLKPISNNQIGIDMCSEETKNTKAAFDVSAFGNVLTISQVQEALTSDVNTAIALTGESTSYIVNTTEIDENLRKLLFKRGKVFARMRPDDKAFIIDKLQGQGHIVGMCGDGANDCPALKIANVGVALSEAEASLAAPFMSKIIDISCIDIILREGKGALVTSFQCFKFMSIYALIQTFNIAILNTRISGMTNGTFLYEDLYVVLPLCLTMGMTAPAEKLTKKRPTENLLSGVVLTGMFGQCIIQVVGQIVAAIVVNKQSWYLTPTFLTDLEIAATGDEEAVAVDWDLTCVFLVAATQFFSTVMTFSIGKPFRKPFYTNWLFTLCILYTTASTLILILIPIQPLYDLLGLRNFDGHQSFRWIILAIAFVNGLITVLYDRVVVPYIFKSIKRYRKRHAKKKVEL